MRGGKYLEFVKLEKPVSVTVLEGLMIKAGTVKKSKIKPIQLVEDVSVINTKSLIDTLKSTFTQMLGPLGIGWGNIVE